MTNIAGRRFGFERIKIVYFFLWLFEIVGETTARTSDHIVRATFAGFVGGGLESVTQKSGVHFFNR